TVCSRSGESTSFSQDMAPVAWSMLRQKHYQMAGFHLPVLSCSSACTHVARLHHPSRSLLDWDPLLAPLVDAARHAHDLRVAHLLQRLSRKPRAPPGCACHDDAGILLRRECW